MARKRPAILEKHRMNGAMCTLAIRETIGSPVCASAEKRPEGNRLSNSKNSDVHHARIIVKERLVDSNTTGLLQSFNVPTLKAARKSVIIMGPRSQPA
jgi:hypothetical protein